MKRTPVILAVAVTASVSAGCMAESPLRGVEITPSQLNAAAKAVDVFSSKPTITASRPHDGMARVGLKLKLREAPKASYSLLALPGSWNAATDTARVELKSPTVNTTGASVSIAQSSFAAGAGADAGWWVAAATFPGVMRPAADYTAKLFLKDTTGTLSGSQTAAVTLNAGANNLDFAVDVNSDEANYKFTASTNNNKYSDGGVTKGDTVTFSTGIDANQPGVDHVKLELSGAAYGGVTCTLKDFPLASAGTWNTFSWDTTANAGVGAPFYQAASLVSPAAGTGSTAGTITVTAYNVDNVAVGTSSYTIAVFGTPSMTVRIQ